MVERLIVPLCYSKALRVERLIDSLCVQCGPGGLKTDYSSLLQCGGPGGCKIDCSSLLL